MLISWFFNSVMWVVMNLPWIIMWSFVGVVGCLVLSGLIELIDDIQHKANGGSSFKEVVAKIETSRNESRNEKYNNKW